MKNWILITGLVMSVGCGSVIDPAGVGRKGDGASDSGGASDGDGVSDGGGQGGRGGASGVSDGDGVSDGRGHGGRGHGGRGGAAALDLPACKQVPQLGGAWDFTEAKLCDYFGRGDPAEVFTAEVTAVTADRVDLSLSGKSNVLRLSGWIGAPLTGLLTVGESVQVDSSCGYPRWTRIRSQSHQLLSLGAHKIDVDQGGRLVLPFGPSLRLSPACEQRPELRSYDLAAGPAAGDRMKGPTHRLRAGDQADVYGTHLSFGGATYKFGASCVPGAGAPPVERIRLDLSQER